MPTIRDDQLEALLEALLSAYPKLSDLRQLAQSSLKIVLDTEVSTSENGGTRNVAWEFICWAKKWGRLDELFSGAMRARPQNEQLRAFAKCIGRATVRGTEQALQKWSFDLEEHERSCRELLEGQLTRGLRVLLLAGAEQEVFDCLTERVRTLVHRSPDRAPPDTDVPLDPRVSNVEKAIERVTRLAHTLAQRHVLVKVHAAEASAATLSGFVVGVRARLPSPLTHDLVLLIRAAAALNPPLPHGIAHVELAPPAFAAKHLYSWVERVSDGQSWSEALKTEFKQVLEALARLQSAPTPGDFYDAVTDAIDCLRGNPDETALREWMAVRRSL